MEDSIRVHVVDKGRRNLYMRYRCPVTGKDETRSTGTAKPKEAAKVAAKWEAELQEGRYQRTSRMGWDEFQQFYEDNAPPNRKPSTAAKYDSTFTAFVRACKPKRVGDLTVERITVFVADLRARGLKEPSVARHLRHLKAVARWAHRQKLLPEVPAFDMPSTKKTAKPKGRPITTEEFERILKAVTDLVDAPGHAEQWKRFLRGLWFSGLRLGEGLSLRWDDVVGGVSVRLKGRQSVLVFHEDSQKNGEAETVELAPEAVMMLEPLERESGFVFELPFRGENKASKLITAFGKKAGVVVNEKTRKTASAHDLRRSFGLRWSKRVMPPKLRSLMRHASIETTMTYYADQEAEQAASELWDVLQGDTLGDSVDCAASGDAVESDVNSTATTTWPGSSVG